MRDESTSGKSEAAAAAKSVAAEGRAAPAQAALVVSLNDLAMTVETLTSSHIRDLIRAQAGALDKIAACGCDGGRCGCFGSDCPCNKVHNDKEDLVSFPEFLRAREAKIEELRKELENLRVAERDLDRLRHDKEPG